jgi:hypothetical protein
MKVVINIVFLLFVSFSAFCQSQTDNLKEILARISENTPSDKLFLHTDRNLYQAGDTIRFQAYIRDYRTGFIETKSASMHVLLIDSAHHTIDSARFRINYSTTSGWLKIPNDVHLGFCTIVAYTSSQMNYDPQYAFRMTIKVDKLRPVNSEASTEAEENRTAADLRFLPEGGTLIAGIKQRLAFNAVDAKGKRLNASGQIINLKGEKIADFRSGPLGPGLIEFTPLPGESYFARPVEKEFGNLSWPLPAADNSGVALRAENNKAGTLDMIVPGRNITGKEYMLAATMNNILIFSKKIIPDTLFSARIKTDELPAGNAFITLYDEELNPVAERVVFINSYKKMKISLDVMPQTSRPGGETELTVNTTTSAGENVSAIISISVIDSISGFYNDTPYPDIETTFLYDREFYNNLPHEIKCIGLGNIDSRSLDLLLMTYGWRKYKLKELVFDEQGPQINDYDHLRITNPGPEKNGRSSINLLSPEGGKAFTVDLDKNREALVTFDSLDMSARQIMIMPDEKLSLNRNPVNIEFPSNPAYSEKAKSVKAEAIIELSSSLKPVFEGILFNPDSAVMIEPVTIKGKRIEQKKYVDKNAETYKYNGAYTLYYEDFKFAQTFEDILYKLNAYKVDKKYKRVILRVEQNLPKMSITSNIMKTTPTALFVVDDAPIFDRTYFPIAQLPASDIASITVVRGPQGFARYGNDARYGMILVTTKTGNRINGIKMPDEDAGQKDDTYKTIKLFRSEIEYYLPTKEQVELIPEYQFRPTLLWKSDVYLDGSAPVKFSYPNNLGSGRVMIYVNGVSITNLVGSGRISYSVR